MTAHTTFVPRGLDREGAAFYLGAISVRKLDELQAQGRITPVALDGRRVYLREDLDKLLDSLKDWADRNA